MAYSPESASCSDAIENPRRVAAIAAPLSGVCRIQSNFKPHWGNEWKAGATFSQIAPLFSPVEFKMGFTERLAKAGACAAIGAIEERPQIDAG
jgi:hypothetical protein